MLMCVCSTWDSGPVPFNRTLDGSLVVPYPVEADLSGEQQQTSANLKAPVL